MKKRRLKRVISFNMSRIKSSGTSIERKMLHSLRLTKLDKHRRNSCNIIGKPDFAWKKHKVAVFCDSAFWHGYRNMSTARHEFKHNKKFWVAKIKRNIERDKEVNRLLRRDGWEVLRFWDFQIKKDINKCIQKIESVINLRKIR